MRLQEALLLLFTATLSFDAVDNILLPENRAHLSLEAQLKELLEKLDMVSTVRSSGARTRRVRLLRREINSIRQKLAQQQNKTMPNGEPVPQEEGLDKSSREGDEEEDKGERLQQDFSSSSPSACQQSAPAASPVCGPDETWELLLGISGIPLSKMFKQILYSFRR